MIFIIQFAICTLVWEQTLFFMQPDSGCEVNYFHMVWPAAIECVMQKELVGKHIS